MRLAGIMCNQLTKIILVSQDRNTRSRVHMALDTPGENSYSPKPKEQVLITSFYSYGAMTPGRIMRKSLPEIRLSACMRGRVFCRFVVTVLALACIATGCASATVLERKTYGENERLPRPHRIIVYHFAATPEDIPSNDPLADLYEKPERPQSADEISVGRKLGAELAAELVKGINELGLHAEEAKTETPPARGDLVIRGAFVSIKEGSRLKRVLIGFGAGAGEIKTLVEVYEITAKGPRPLVSEEIESKGGKLPGMVFAVAAAVVTGPAGLAVSPVATAGTAGAAGEAAAGSGGVNVAKELGPESLGAAIKRTADEVKDALSVIFRKHGWIGPR
jgi:hypothetical protein